MDHRRGKLNKGIWLYGLSGSGKSFASAILHNTIKMSYVIDGDDVRRFISRDLNYTVEDRSIQLTRCFGLAQLTLKNGLFPIISTVSMNKDILKLCCKIEVDVVEIQRSREQLEKISPLYSRNNVNVVGLDIPVAPLNTKKIKNSGNRDFVTVVKDHVYQR